MFKLFRSLLVIVSSLRNVPNLWFSFHIPPSILWLFRTPPVENSKSHSRRNIFILHPASMFTLIPHPGKPMLVSEILSAMLEFLLYRQQSIMKTRLHLWKFISGTLTPPCMLRRNVGARATNEVTLILSRTFVDVFISGDVTLGKVSCKLSRTGRSNKLARQVADITVP